MSYNSIYFLYLPPTPVQGSSMVQSGRLYSPATCVCCVVQPLRPDCTTHLERSARQTISCVCGHVD